MKGLMDVAHIMQNELERILLIAMRLSNNLQKQLLSICTRSFDFRTGFMRFFKMPHYFFGCSKTQSTTLNHRLLVDPANSHVASRVTLNGKIRFPTNIIRRLPLFLQDPHDFPTNFETDFIIMGYSLKNERNLRRDVE